VDAPPVLNVELVEIAADIDAAAVQALKQEAGDSRTHVIAIFDAKSQVNIGDSVRLSVDTNALLFFDADTTSAIGALP
jgi:hypothetical protein